MPKKSDFRMEYDQFLGRLADQIHQSMPDTSRSHPATIGDVKDFAEICFRAFEEIEDIVDKYLPE